MEIEARHLRLVKSIADAGSITSAATALGSTQPALTRQLRRVEEGLGGELFVRSRDGVEPTTLGRLVVGRANAVLSVLDSLQTDVATATATAPAQVRIGVRYGQAMLGLMNGLRATVPNAEIVTNSESRIGGLIDLVAGNRLDVAVIHEFVGYEIPLDPRILSTEICSQPAFVLIPETHPLAARTEVALADLADENWLLSPLDVDRETECMTQVCADAGFTPKIVHYLSDGLGVELIRAGEAIAPSVPTNRCSGAVLKPLVDSPIRVRQLLIAERHNPLVTSLDKLARFVGDALADALSNQPIYTAWAERHEGD
ncbi:LysR family transcriptional regulator [Solicola gregarius]|uniref:LysR family transcriptional regulator n=1 Tax=Solicola gregarius TaxID=2908642 RepID=A0AA46TLH9_9ACTN|nr:LysR family transcriptional regulator [Solicola gregarius]UYM07492.1 LysR family transcriptional regulator [Solicola gregarius]